MDIGQVYQRIIKTTIIMIKINKYDPIHEISPAVAEEY